MFLGTTDPTQHIGWRQKEVPPAHSAEPDMVPISPAINPPGCTGSAEAAAPRHCHIVRPTETGGQTVILSPAAYDNNIHEQHSMHLS